MPCLLVSHSTHPPPTGFPQLQWGQPLSVPGPFISHPGPNHSSPWSCSSCNHPWSEQVKRPQMVSSIDSHGKPTCVICTTTSECQWAFLRFVDLPHTAYIPGCVIIDECRLVVKKFTLVNRAQLHSSLLCLVLQTMLSLLLFIVG